MKRLLSILVVVAACAWGQQPGSQTVQRVISLKYADANTISRLVSAPGIDVRPDSAMHVVVVRGQEYAVAEIEALVKQLDISPQDIELTAYLVSGSSQGSGDEVPKELTSTTKQLHGLFPYKTYRLLESFVLRGRNGTNGMASGVIGGTESSYNFDYNSITVSSGTPRVVHVDRMSLRLSTATSKAVTDKEGHTTTETNTRNDTISTNIDVGEGQQVVVGKSSVNKAGDAIILVVTAKVVE